MREIGILFFWFRVGITRMICESVLFRSVLPIWSVPMIWSLPLQVLLKSMNSILPSSKYDEGGWKVIRGRGSRASSTVAVVFGDLLAAVHSASAVPLGLFGGGLVG